MPKPLQIILLLSLAGIVLFFFWDAFRENPAMDGLELLKKDDYANAYKCFKKAADEDNPVGQLGMGFLLSEGKGCKKDIASAKKYLKQAADNGIPSAWSRLAYIYEIEEDKEKARKYFQKAADAGDPQGQNGLAYTLACEGEDLTRAALLIYKAMETEPDNPAYIDTWGWVLYKQGKYENALIQIRKASLLIPNDPEVLDHLGDVYDKLGKPEEARKAWKNALKNCKDNPKLSSSLEQKLKGTP